MAPRQKQRFRPRFAIEDRHHSECSKCYVAMATIGNTCSHIQLHVIKLKSLICMLHIFSEQTEITAPASLAGDSLET
jgi:hypothetical protein